MTDNTSLSTAKIGILGLGYVGLPLAVEFGKIHDVVGFDISSSRINKLNCGVDETFEVSSEQLKLAAGLSFSDDIASLTNCNTYIVTVPTPVDDSKRPDMSLLIEASRLVGTVLSCGNTVIYESTVYPGATEEICVPVLEEVSGLSFNSDFFVGYSPERINPGDKQHTVRDIVKVTSGLTEDTALFVDALYASVVNAGTYRAKNIKTAEAAKVIENVQRDVNIALVNDLAMLFDKLGLDSSEVLDASATKWNFLPFRPGLVGGHCIGVDPYYLTYKAQQVGHHPEIILTGRRINDGMSSFVAAKLFKAMSKRSMPIQGAQILVLGFTFKENCPDIRNTRVNDLVRELTEFGAVVDVTDPWVDPAHSHQIFGITVTNEVVGSSYDAVILAVAHRQFISEGGAALRGYCKDRHIIFDLKSCLGRDESDLRL